MTSLNSGESLISISSDQNKIVSLAKGGERIEEIIGKTIDRIRVKIQNDRDKKTTLLDISILDAWDTSNTLNSKIHIVIECAIKIISQYPDIGAGNATIKLIKDCLLNTNPNEYHSIKNKLLELSEYDFLSQLGDDDWYIFLLESFRKTISY